MLRFFRTLRQRLLAENRVSRYLLYAAGEVFLIVVGILLALYLNNLNEERQTRSVEIKLLNELKSNLESNLLILERSLRTEEEYLAYNQQILDYLDNRKPYHEELDKAFGVYFWTVSTNPVSGGYEFLKSKGVDLITNDSLRNRISFVFENEFSILKNENEVWSNNLQQTISYPNHIQRFRRYYPDRQQSNGIEFARPYNYDLLLEDETFKSINAEIVSNRMWNINSLNRLLMELRDLILQIETELEN